MHVAVDPGALDEASARIKQAIAGDGFCSDLTTLDSAGTPSAAQAIAMSVAVWTNEASTRRATLEALAESLTDTSKAAALVEQEILELIRPIIEALE
jgi:hypothetical protein